jgi:hypothetical protein
MKTLRQDARRQLEQFLSTLFLPDELIEVRFIESWVSGGKKRSRVVRSGEWLRRSEFVSQYREINTFARRERANVYFGVCPRPQRGDAQDDSIQTVRCVWCDIDYVTFEEAYDRWKDARIPPPSIVVSSGSGIHGYWLLDRDLRSQRERTVFSSMLPHFYRSFGGDHVQNLSRIMRAPGTANCKDARNGRPTRRCLLLGCQPELRYPLATFSRWVELATREQRQRTMPAVPDRSATVIADEASLDRKAKVLDVLRHLEKPSRDRSRRDFAVVCDLLRLGLTREEIWPLVCDCSKFEANGRPYFDVTVTNAERTVLCDRTPAGQSERAT